MPIYAHAFSHSDNRIAPYTPYTIYHNIPFPSVSWRNRPHPCLLSRMLSHHCGSVVSYAHAVVHKACRLLMLPYFRTSKWHARQIKIISACKSSYYCDIIKNFSSFFQRFFLIYYNVKLYNVKKTQLYALGILWTITVKRKIFYLL